MVDRIQLILKVNNLTASKFADEIGVQRSSISHILSGRNLPSLDLIQKILRRFSEINSDWLLNGNGSMMKTVQPDLFNLVEPEVVSDENVNLQQKVSMETKHQIENKIFEKQIISDEKEQFKAAENQIFENVTDNAEEYLKEKGLNSEILVSETKNLKPSIEKIVIFYSNKTFREYFPE